MGGIRAELFRNVKILSKVRQIGSHWVTWVTSLWVAQSGSQVGRTISPAKVEISKWLDWAENLTSDVFLGGEYEYAIHFSIGIRDYGKIGPLGFGTGKFKMVGLI